MVAVSCVVPIGLVDCQTLGSPFGDLQAGLGNLGIIFYGGMETLKKCSTCGEKKERTEFHKDRNKPDGLNWRCKPCQAARSKEPGQVYSNWRAATVRKRGLEVAISLEQFIELRARTTCECCGKTMVPGNRDLQPSIDRMDNSLGYVYENLTTICYRCNSLKNCNTPETLQMLVRFMGRRLDTADVVSRVAAIFQS
jgi:hypothetical protein